VIAEEFAAQSNPQPERLLNYNAERLKTAQL
jgi:hypothetical protein